ncbi:hypothetical protein ABZ547_09900 [Streptomyces sparsogenes]|uniref:hypothetical protein n=1 Tax=Streptomyces sparsogenes TaxID=67365 RepID=UPI0033D492C9
MLLLGGHCCHRCTPHAARPVRSPPTVYDGSLWHASFDSIATTGDGVDLTGVEVTAVDGQIIVRRQA